MNPEFASFGFTKSQKGGISIGAPHRVRTCQSIVLDFHAGLAFQTVNHLHKLRMWIISGFNKPATPYSPCHCRITLLERIDQLLPRNLPKPLEDRPSRTKANQQNARNHDKLQPALNKALLDYVS